MKMDQEGLKSNREGVKMFFCLTKKMSVFLLSKKFHFLVKLALEPESKIAQSLAARLPRYR